MNERAAQSARRRLAAEIVTRILAGQPKRAKGEHPAARRGIIAVAAAVLAQKPYVAPVSAYYDAATERAAEWLDQHYD